MIVALVAALARGGVIGRDGEIPWRVPEDVAHFKELTTGHAVVMGRRTWESIPDRFRPLPDRRNVVVTRNPDWRTDGAERAASVEEALEILADELRVFVIGGAEIYAAALPFGDELVLTEIDLTVDGDTFFPEWDRNAFVEVTRVEAIAADGTPFAFVTYDRNAALQLAAVGAVDALLEGEEIPYWLFGGWAVDFHAGAITRPHGDVDIAVWLEDVARVAELLERDGWRHTPHPDDDGGTRYERDGVRLDLTFLGRSDTGAVYTQLRDRRAAWPEGTFAADTRELAGVHARVASLQALTKGKSAGRDDPDEAARVRADFDVLSGLQPDG